MAGGAGARGAPLLPLPRSLAPPAVYNAAAPARGDLRAVQPRQRSLDDAHVLGRGTPSHAKARARGHDAHSRAGQLRPHRPQRRGDDPDARVGLRPRPVRRSRCLRGGAHLLSRGLHQARQAPPVAQVLPQGRVRHPHLPAAVPAVQAEAVRSARARDHAVGEARRTARPRRSSSASAPPCRPRSATTTST